MPTNDTKFSFIRKRLVRAGIYLEGEVIQKIDYLGAFYLNPSTWTDSKSANWVKHHVPGTSDPHQQWTSSGARTITFEAYVTNDLVDGNKSSNAKNARINNSATGQTSIVNRIGSIATQVFNLSGLDLTGVAHVNNSAGLDLDITDKLNYYRSLCYPNLTTDANRVASAPPLVFLVVGTTFGKRVLGAKFAVDKVDITITRQYPDLTPIEAKVVFSLTEFVDGILGANNNIISDV